MKVSYINLTEVDVDGCGTNITSVIKTNAAGITNGMVERIRNAISDYKADNEGEWDTDGCIDAALEQLKKEGYIAEIITTTEIEF